MEEQPKKAYKIKSSTNSAWTIFSKPAGKSKKRAEVVFNEDSRKYVSVFVARSLVMVMIGQCTIAARHTHSVMFAKKSQVSVPLASIQRFDFCQAPHSFVTKMFYLLVSLVTNREFVGGFHKRKMQRRALAQGQKDAQEKQVRLEEKKQVHNIDLLSGGFASPETSKTICG
jgi:hypothetical protein